MATTLERTRLFEAWGGSLALLLSRLTAENWQPSRCSQPADYVPVVWLPYQFRPEWRAHNSSHSRQSDLAVLLGIFLGEEVSCRHHWTRCSARLPRNWCGNGVGWRPAL